MEGDWMSAPQVISDCPPGLEYLTTIDQLLVEQKIKMTWTRAPNEFIMKNSTGQNVYRALEDSDSSERNCYGRDRSFDMIIQDNYENEVIHVYRPRTTDCCFRNLSKVEISAPPGTLIGTVEEEWKWFIPSFIIKNVSGDIILTIAGPSGLVNIGDIDFQVMSGNGSMQLGKISKQFKGWNKIFTTTEDYFGITFPMDLDVRMKALLIGALFLIDIRLYEH